MQSDARTIRDLQAQPAAHLARCRALLVETAIALVIDPRVNPVARSILIARLAVASSDLGAVPDDDPVFLLRVAVDRVVQAHEQPDRWAWQQIVENDLRRELRSYFTRRSDQTHALIAGS